MENIRSLRKLVIVCGGTGGHFFPGLSIARNFVSRGGEARLLLSGKNARNQAETAATLGIGSEILPASPPPIGAYRKILFILSCLRDIVISLAKYRRSRPDAVLAMGSFNCIAPSIAARIAGIPLFLHDGNARVGRANLALSRYARAIFLSFPPVNSQHFNCPSKVTGMPLRPEILSGKTSRTEAISRINSAFGTGFSADRTFVLVFGGSQGASSINSAAPDALAKIAGRHSIQAVHICGFHGLENVSTRYADAGFPHLVIESAKEMHIFYSAADFILCRSGGSTIAELAFFAKFAILAPFPHASDNHQEDNALHFLSAGCGLCIPDSELNSDKIAAVLGEILQDKENHLKMSLKAGQLARPGASDEIIASIDETIQTH